MAAVGNLVWILLRVFCFSHYARPPLRATSSLHQTSQKSLIDRFEFITFPIHISNFKNINFLAQHAYQYQTLLFEQSKVHQFSASFIVQHYANIIHRQQSNRYGKPLAGQNRTRTRTREREGEREKYGRKVIS